MTSAQKYLEANLDDIDSSYALAILTYALLKSNSSEAEDTLTRFESFGKSEGKCYLDIQQWSFSEKMSLKQHSCRLAFFFWQISHKWHTYCFHYNLVCLSVRLSASLVVHMQLYFMKMLLYLVFHW